MTGVPALQAYRALDVMADSPGRCVIKLYQHLTVMMRSARVDLETSTFESAARHLDRARATIEELICALNFEQGGDIARNLASIYGFMLRELLSVGISRDPDPLARLVSMTESLLEAWLQAVADQEGKRPVHA